MMTPWMATHVRRWHANPALCHTVDPIGFHSGRMGVLALHFWGAGASRDLLVACLCHDLGESATGDVPWDVKRDNPDLKAILDRIEANALADMGLAFDLSPDDARRLQFLDRLDAYGWAQHHAPHVMRYPDWREARAWIEAEAAALGVEVAL